MEKINNKFHNMYFLESWYLFVMKFPDLRDPKYHHQTVDLNESQRISLILF